MERGWGWEAVQPVKCLLYKNEGLSSGPQQSTELGIMVLINKHSNGVDRGKKTPGTHRWLPRTHGHTLAYAWACVQAHAPKTWGKGRHFATWRFGRPRIRWLQRTLVHPFLFACLPSFFVLFLLFTTSCNFSNSVDCCSASDCHLQLEQCLPWEAPIGFLGIQRTPAPWHLWDSKNIPFERQIESLQQRRAWKSGLCCGGSGEMFWVSSCWQSF